MDAAEIAACEEEASKYPPAHDPEWVRHKIALLRREGYPRDQAVAIAFHMDRDRRMREEAGESPLPPRRLPDTNRDKHGNIGQPGHADWHLRRDQQGRFRTTRTNEELAQDFPSERDAVEHAKAEGATHLRHHRNRPLVYRRDESAGYARWMESEIYPHNGKWHLTPWRHVNSLDTMRVPTIDTWRPRAHEDGASEGAPVIYEEGTAPQAQEETMRDAHPVGADGVPWVKVVRDEKFASCMARAKALGEIRTPQKVYELMHDHFIKEDQETLVIIPLDVRFHLRCGVVEVHRGGRSHVDVEPADVMRAILVTGAENVVMCHSHPSTTATPSDADRRLTKTIERLCKPYKIVLVDHCVLGGGEIYSIRADKLIKVK